MADERTAANEIMKVIVRWCEHNIVNVIVIFIEVVNSVFSSKSM